MNRFNEQIACFTYVKHLNNILQKEGKPDFTLTKDNRLVIKKLVYYFCRQPYADINLKKGICLQGPVGTGKSTIMRAFSIWSPLSFFRMANCRDIQKEVASKGFPAITKYTAHSYNFKNGFYRPENGAIIYCFDDFGAEEKSKFYGTEINVMAELFEDRYQHFDINGMLTHMTTNIRDGAIYERDYNIRVRDRSRQMFNFIELGGPSFRR